MKCKNCSNLFNLSDDQDVIVGKWCPKVNDSPHEDLERECDYFQQRTNFEKITESVETLAEYICLHEWSMADYKMCVDWLRSEAKGEE